MHPVTQAPDKIAAVMTGSGETLSYGELEQRSVQLDACCSKRGCGRATCWRC